MSKESDPLDKVGKKSPKSQAEQSERFIRAAVEAGVDTTGKFERALDQIVSRKAPTSGRR